MSTSDRKSFIDAVRVGLSNAQDYRFSLGPPDPNVVPDPDEDPFDLEVAGVKAAANAWVMRNARGIPLCSREVREALEAAQGHTDFGYETAVRLIPVVGI